VVGGIVAMLAAAALVWLVVNLVNAEDARDEEQVVPSSDVTPSSGSAATTVTSTSTSEGTS
jgi:hypothetical protein